MNHSILWMLVYKGHSQLLSVDCFLRCCGVLTKYLLISHSPKSLVVWSSSTDLKSMARFSSIQPRKFSSANNSDSACSAKTGLRQDWAACCHFVACAMTGYCLKTETNKKGKRIDAKKQWWWLLRQVVVYTILFLFTSYSTCTMVLLFSCLCCSLVSPPSPHPPLVIFLPSFCLPVILFLLVYGV